MESISNQSQWFGTETNCDRYQKREAMIEHQDWTCLTNKLCNKEGRRQDNDDDQSRRSRWIATSHVVGCIGKGVDYGKERILMKRLRRGLHMDGVMLIQGGNRKSLCSTSMLSHGGLPWRSSRTNTTRVGGQKRLPAFVSFLQQQYYRLPDEKQQV